MIGTDTTRDGLVSAPLCANRQRDKAKRREEEEDEKEESLFKADAVNEEDPERDRATQV